ncbi:hypothetical protein [Paenisporosarcina cavernae]|uniref:SWIM-type domain-containing protein n=1 Tax=Paenisporosarcina cavernae TaxID=2320858 RepID=A0A385YTQ0_9BACL|nr:hypothetical protein [Paenisporosarcina cavernae]AYC28853.1 hypothetical protein D3873_02815 [Paenisporosarcina cavernae]
MSAAERIGIKYAEPVRKTIHRLEKRYDMTNPRDEHAVRRSLFLVRNGQVKVVAYQPNEHKITFTIRDAHTIQGHYFPLQDQFECECGTEGGCRHELVMALMLYQYQMSLSQWMKDFKAKTPPLELPVNDRTPDSWKAIVEYHTYAFLRKVNWYDMYHMPILFRELKERIARSRPFEREWLPMYHFYTTLLMISIIWKSLPEDNPYSARNLLEEELFSLNAELDSLQSSSKLFAFDPFLADIRLMVRELALLEGFNAGQRRVFYTNYLLTLLPSKKDMEEELQIVLASKTEQAVLLHATIAVIVKDEAAYLQALQSVRLDLLESWLSFADFVAQSPSDHLLEPLLRKMMPFLANYLTNSTSTWHRNTVVNDIYQLYAQIDLTETEWEQLFFHFGEHGLRPYSQFLLERGRYKEWVSLHHVHNSSINFAESCGLSRVMQEAPSELLPFYHFLAMKEVAARSRANYTQAVRIWKKMKTAAKKAGQVDFWQDYLTEIQTQYKRLRALQEEIQKGSLTK